MADGSAPDVPVERLRRKVVRNHRAGRSLTPKPGSTAERQMRAALELDGIELRGELMEIARSRPRTFGSASARPAASARPRTPAPTARARTTSRSTSTCSTGPAASAATST